MSRPQPVSTVFLALIIATASVGTNSAIPTVPGIEASFQSGAGTGAWIVGAFAMGYALGHLALGLIADRANRKNLLVASLAGFSVASILIVVAQNQALLLWARFAQGLFASGGPIIGRAILRASGDFQAAARKMSGASAIFSWAPVAAPAVAGTLIAIADWRSVYVMLAIYGLAACWLTARIDSNWYAEPDRKITVRRSLTGDLFELLCNRAFQHGLITTVFIFGGFLAILAATPDLVAGKFAHEAALSILVTAVAAAYAIGGAVSRVWLNYLDSESILKRTALIAVIPGPLLLLNSVTMNEFWVLPGTLVLYGLCAGIINPNGTVLAMRDLPGSSAMAAALVGGSKMLAASAAAALLGFLPGDPVITLAWILFGSAVFALSGIAGCRPGMRVH